MHQPGGRRRPETRRPPRRIGRRRSGMPAPKGPASRGAPQRRRCRPPRTRGAQRGRRRRGPATPPHEGAPRDGSDARSPWQGPRDKGTLSFRQDRTRFVLGTGSFCSAGGRRGRRRADKAKFAGSRWTGRELASQAWLCGGSLALAAGGSRLLNDAVQDDLLLPHDARFDSGRRFERLHLILPLGHFRSAFCLEACILVTRSSAALVSCGVRAARALWRRMSRTSSIPASAFGNAAVTRLLWAWPRAVSRPPGASRPPPPRA